MKDGIVIQARTGSTRLHNKILLPFDGERCILDILIGNSDRHHSNWAILAKGTVYKTPEDMLDIFFNCLKKFS